MKKYSFTCTCGYKISLDAADEDEAKAKLREAMPEEAAKAHFANKHAGEEMPPYEDLMASAVLTEEPAKGMETTAS